MVICCSLPVPRSLADTFTIPFASISKVTSICGTPLLAGRIPSRRNCPRVLLSLANSRSPCTTWISTAVWLSAAVEKNLALLGRDGCVSLDQSGSNTAHGLDGQGTAELHPEEGYHLHRHRLLTYHPGSLQPMATHSSGFKDFIRLFAGHLFYFLLCRKAYVVEPPTNRTFAKLCRGKPAIF